MVYEKRQVWGVLIRLFHWTFALSILALVATGLYIHEPWTNSVVEGTGAFPVGWTRYFHFVLGFAFTGAVAVRIYLWIFGNRFERILDFAPVTPRNIGNFFHTIGYYLYIDRARQHRLGHNVLAGTFYLVTLVMAIFQILSGFYLLYPESVTWQAWGLKIFGTQQQARIFHHMALWYFLLFAMTHVYIVIWNDIRNPEGLISSIFNGDKFAEK